MQNQLNKILAQLERQEGNQQELGYRALDTIKNSLEKTPFNVDLLVTRMRLNANIFENTTAIIQDATFIIENDQFKQNKQIGYDWLFWIYNSVLSIPEKAEEVIEEQLIDIQSLFEKKHEKDEIEGELLNKYAQFKFDNNKKEEAVKLWEKSFDKHPFLSNRNGFVGLYLLEIKDFELAKKFLFIHYDWCYNTEDGFRLKYGIKLNELYNAKALENEPDLCGLLFNIIRNEEDYFKLDGKLDFFEKYYPELQKLGDKFPDSSLLWTAISNTHFFDTKNYQNAFEAYTKLAKTKDFFRYSSLEKAIKAAKKSDNNFFDLNFSFNHSHSANNYYNYLTDLSNACDKTKSKKKKKKFSELAVSYGKKGYEAFSEYLIDGIGSTQNNHPHIYAMLCNNYANAMGEYAEFHFEDDDLEKDKLYKEAGDIHVKGHDISPFRENMVNAAHDYFSGKDYANAIKYTLQSLTEYKQDFSVYDFQSHYFRIVTSSINLDKLETAEIYYNKAKKLYNKVGKDSKNANYKFIFSSKLFFEYIVTEKKEYQKYIPEMEWFLNNEVALKQEPKEHGLISYYLGLCYIKTNQKEKAIAALQTTIEHLHDIDWEFYELKSEHAEELIEELGGKVQKKKISGKKKSVFKRLLDAILFPFMVLALIGGVIWAAVRQNNYQDKE